MTVELGPHAGFIVSAYAVALGIVAGLILWIVLDRRHLARALDGLETQGVSRRSAAGGREPT
ncbi:MAG TPA: heme exporter protein CcmD [Xanthobacteraceae bacterium]